MNSTDIERLIYAWLEPAVQCWCKDQIRNMQTAYYAYYKAGTHDSYGAIVISENAPNEDWHLITGERISLGDTAETVKQKLFAFCQRLPLLKMS